MMDERLATRLTTTTEEFDEIIGLLSDPDVLADQKRYREVTARHSELKPVVDAYRRYREADTESREALEMAAEDDDPPAWGSFFLLTLIAALMGYYICYSS